MADETPPARKKEPTLSKAPPPGRKFPCKQCGARLDFDPSARALKCPYCGYEEKVQHERKQVNEYAFEDYLTKNLGKSTVAGRSSEVTCTTCGAVVLLEDKVQADKCPYCATFLENKAVSAEAMIPPECVLPFLVDKKQAIKGFADWLGALWFAPGTLRQFANLGQLNGVYVPFWTFDSMTYTEYAGERGINHTSTSSYTDSQGRRHTRTVTVTHWTPVSGEVQHFFDDVLVCASHSIPAQYVGNWHGEELKRVVSFQPEYLSGFVTERYTVHPKEGFNKAQEIMDAHIRELCRQDIGGDHQRVHEVNTQHVGVTFKLALLPLWLASYRYQDKVYRITVNGRTGEVVGDRPYSWVKISILVACIVLAVLALVGLFMLLAGQ